MPKLSDSMEEATVIRWLKKPGEAFRRGEPVVEIETDKATVVYEAETDGILVSILVPDGAVAKLGEPIASLEDIDARAAAKTIGRHARASATPVARRKAAEIGIALHEISGSGPGGRITVKDVEQAAAEARAPAPAGDEKERSGADKGTVEVVPLSPTRATIARRLSHAAATIPAFQVTVEIDMSAIVELRRRSEAVSLVPSINDFVVRAAALTLRAFPAFNSSFSDGSIHRYSRINLGIAVAVEDMLLVPTLFDADSMTLAQIAAKSRELADQARRRRLEPTDLTQSTFTVSNLGMYGVHSFSALIDPPQTAILAVGSVARRLSEKAGAVAFRDTMLATLSADHRVVNGADGARFLARLKTLLESPLCLLL